MLVMLLMYQSQHHVVAAELYFSLALPGANCNQLFVVSMTIRDFQRTVLLLAIVCLLNKLALNSNVQPTILINYLQAACAH